VALGIRGREILGITCLVFVIVSIMTLVHLSTVTRLVVQDAAEKGHLQARQIFSGSTRALGRGDRARPGEALRRDRELRALLDSSIGYSPHLLYAMITDRSHTVLVHSERRREGQKAPPRPQIEDLTRMNPLRQMLALARERQVYESTLPLSLNGRLFGAIRLGLAGSLLWRELSSAAKRSLLLAGLSLPLAWGVALALSNLISAPLRRIAQDVDRMVRGEFDVASAFGRDDELGHIAAKLSLLGRHIQEDRSTLLSEKATLEGIVHRLEDAIILLNRDGSVIFANPSAEAILAKPLLEAAGQPLSELLGADHPLEETLGDAFRLGQPVRNVALQFSVDQHGPVNMLASAYPVLDERGVVGGMILLKNTEPLQQIQSLVDYSQKLADLGKLTSGVAHEVKNPLNAMMIHLELLRQKLHEAPGEVAQTLDVLGGEIRRLDRVVQGFLRFMRPQTLTLLPLDINSLLQKVAELIAAEWADRRVTLTLRLDHDVPAINGDAELLRQAFVNLLLNASQAMPDGGAVTLSTERSPQGAAIVRVADEGVGIAPEDLDKIFRLYYTTKPDGSGIGLSLVYRIVQMHGGGIKADSDLGKGTVMTLTFPAA
jgi:signal transduction histidine kinase